MTRRIATLVASAALLAAVPATAAAPAKITGSGVGKVKLGAAHADLRASGLVGRLQPGCELGGPETRSARLKAPLKGFVTYSLTAPRKVREITVTGGARARGVGIGATIAEIRAKFPKAKVVRATEETFGITLVRIPKDGGGRFQFAVDVDTGRTTLIGVPRISFCE